MGAFQLNVTSTESQSLRIALFFDDQKYSIKLKTPENFSFLVWYVSTKGGKAGNQWEI